MLSIVKPFVVWALYPALIDYTGQDYLLSALICLAFMFTISFGNLRRGFLIDWTAALYFVAMCALELTIGSSWLVAYPLVTISGVYALVAAASLLLRRPYTLQYARETTPEELWDDPHFLKINYHLTAVWTAIFILCLFLSLLAVVYADYWPIFVLIRDSLIAIGLVVPEQYPKFYLRRLDAADV